MLIRRIPLRASAAMRRLACGLGPAPSFGGPVRDEGVVGSGEPAQGGGLAGERLIVPARGGALEDAGYLGQQVGPACGEFAEFGHRGGLLVAGEVAPSGVVPGGSGELGDQEPVSSRREMILVHSARIERISDYLKQAGEPSRQSCGEVAVSSDIPGCRPTYRNPRPQAVDRDPGLRCQASTGLPGQRSSADQKTGQGLNDLGRG